MKTADPLEKLLSQKGANGVTLHEHLCLLLQVIAQKGVSFANYENFELLSDFVKKNTFTWKPPLPDTLVNQPQESTCPKKEWAKKVIDLFQVQFYQISPNIFAENQ